MFKTRCKFQISVFNLCNLQFTNNSSLFSKRTKMSSMLGINFRANCFQNNTKMHLGAYDLIEIALQHHQFACRVHYQEQKICLTRQFS